MFIPRRTCEQHQGVLREHPLCFHLDCDDGKVLRLAPEASLQPYLGQRVTLRGQRQGSDTMNVVEIRPV